MKRVWLYTGVAVALAGLASIAVSFANPLRRGEQPDNVTEADAMPPYEVLTTVRGLGFDPISRPVRRGNYYVLHAYDARGNEMRIVADVQFGDIVSVAPARAANAAYAPQQQYYGGAGPRIIQVPDNYRSNGAVEVPQQQLPQPRRRATAPAKTYNRSVTTPENDAPNDANNSVPAQEEQKPKLPPLRERRVLERPDGGLSPIYPTGRWRSRVEEFGQPPVKRAPNATTNVDINTTGPEQPPIGYTPPKVKGTIRMIEPARPAEPATGTEPALSKDETVQTPAQDNVPAQANAESVVKAIEPAAQDQQPAAQDDEQPPQNETRD